MEKEIRKLQIQLEQKNCAIRQYRKQNAKMEQRIFIYERNLQQRQKKGRPAVSAEQKRNIIVRSRKGQGIREIAAVAGVSTGAVCQILKQYKINADTPWMRTFYYMSGDELCSIIRADHQNQQVTVENFTDDVLKRAFGILENPSWEDFMKFLESRCFPRSRDHMKNILRNLGLPGYDPLAIVEKTLGKMAEDDQWIDLGR